MSPRPSRDREDLQAKVREAKTRRDQAIEAAEREFWAAIGAIAASYHGAQTDAAAELDITPRWLAKQVQRHRTTD